MTTTLQLPLPLGPAVPNPTLNLLAIGLHPGGMNAVSFAALAFKE